MKYKSRNIKEELGKLLDKYPNLKVTSINKDKVSIQGKIHIYRVVHDFPVNKEYTIKIIIPLHGYEIPKIIDINDEIDPSYHHKYKNKELCLETDIKMFIHFTDGFSLVQWMDEFVEPYYVSYEYYRLYKDFPYGERAHGARGIIDSYADILKTNNINETIMMICYVAYNRYRGHQPCPCKSGKKLRCCHGKNLIKFYMLDGARDKVKRDVEAINEENRKRN